MNIDTLIKELRATNESLIAPAEMSTTAKLPSVEEINFLRELLNNFISGLSIAQEKSNFN